MAVGLVIAQGVNAALQDTSSPDYGTVETAVTDPATTTVGGAVDKAGFYSTLAPRPLTAKEVAEAKAVFTAMPDTLNAAILAALRNAFSRKLVIRVNWVEITAGLMHTHMEESADGTTLLLQLWTRDGGTYPPAGGGGVAADALEVDLMEVNVVEVED